MFRFLAGAAILLIASTELALAAPGGSCDDTQGDWSLSHLGRTGPDDHRMVPAYSRYWIIPTSNGGPRTSSALTKTFTNLRYKYISKNAPTIICPNNNFCTSPRVRGGFFLELDYTGNLYGSKKVSLPGRNGNFFDVKVSDDSNNITGLTSQTISQCLKGRGIRYKLYFVFADDTEERLPFLLFQESSYTLRYTPHNNYRGM